MPISPWQFLATLRDLHEVGVPAQALTSKSVAEKRRALVRASSSFVAFLRKRYKPPLALALSDLEVTSAAGTATAEGSPVGSAADVRIEVVAGGLVSGGAVTVRLSRDDGTAGTWGTTFQLAPDGVVQMDGVTVTLAGTWATGEAVTYSAGPDPGIRGAVAALAAYNLLYNRGADPKTSETYQRLYDQAIGYARELCKGDGPELAEDADATPGRHEGGPMWEARTRDGFLRGEA